MNEKILTGEVQQFIEAHGDDDPVRLVLKGGELAGVPMKEVAEQIASRKKLLDKCPRWVSTPGIYFPPPLSVEQCSSEATAAFKASLFSGDVLVDLTGGLGIDDDAFSRVYKKVIYVEQEETLCELARHNFKTLGLDNISVTCSRAEKYVDTVPPGADVFIDPSRRAEGKKVYRLGDCQPEVAGLVPLLLDKGCRVLVKAAPLLDIKQGLEELPGTSRVYVVAVDNECKEVLFLLEKNAVAEPTIHAINLTRKGQDQFVFTYREEQITSPEFSTPLQYIYEPNSALLKAGAFKLAGNRYGLAKLHASTHLYTSGKIVTDFPGRVFLLKGVLKVQKKEVQKVLPTGRANVFTRNFPLSATQLRDRLGLLDGGREYLCGITDTGDRKVLLWLERAYL